jgi:hypothetical protein
LWRNPGWPYLFCVFVNKNKKIMAREPKKISFILGSLDLKTFMQIYNKTYSLLLFLLDFVE